MAEQRKPKYFFGVPLASHGEGDPVTSEDLPAPEDKIKKSLAGLRSIIDKAGTGIQKPVVSLPRFGSIESARQTGKWGAYLPSTDSPLSQRNVLDAIFGHGALESLGDLSNIEGGGVGRAGLPFTAYQKGGLKRVFHGTNKPWDYTDPNKFDKSDVLGHMFHSAEDPEYAGQYALGQAKGYGTKGNNPRLIPIVPEAKNVLDLVDPNPDDISQAMAFAENKRQLIEWFKRTRKQTRKSPTEQIEDYVYGGGPSFKHTAHYQAPKEEHPIRAVAENIRLSPETTENMPWDAIRYHDMDEKSWAFPKNTPLFSEFGAPLTEASHTVPVSPLKMYKMPDDYPGNPSHLPVVRNPKTAKPYENMLNKDFSAKNFVELYANKKEVAKDAGDLFDSGKLSASEFDAIINAADEKFYGKSPITGGLITGGFEPSKSPSIGGEIPYDIKKVTLDFEDPTSAKGYVQKLLNNNNLSGVQSYKLNKLIDTKFAEKLTPEQWESKILDEQVGKLDMPDKAKGKYIAFKQKGEPEYQYFNNAQEAAEVGNKPGMDHDEVSEFIKYNKDILKKQQSKLEDPWEQAEEDSWKQTKKNLKPFTSDTEFMGAAFGSKPTKLIKPVPGYGGNYYKIGGEEFFVDESGIQKMIDKAEELYNYGNWDIHEYNKAIKEINEIEASVKKGSK